MRTITVRIVLREEAGREPAGWLVELWSQWADGRPELLAAEPLGDDLVRVATGEDGYRDDIAIVFNPGAGRVDRRAAGERLFASVFRGEVARRWALERKAASHKHRIRVRLDATSSRLKALP